jgi:hypothetical protein
MIVTGPAVLPLWRITEALPFIVEAVAVCEPMVDPIYEPPPGPFMVKFTVVPSATGLPFTSFTENIIVDVAV